MLPKKLENFSVVFEGRPMAGLVEEIVLPNLDRKMEEYRGAGMLGPVSLDLGMEAMKLELTFGEFNEDVLKAWGVPDASGLGVRFLGAARADGGSGGTNAIEVSVRGRWKKIDKGNAKLGDHSKMKVEMPLTFFEYRVNGTTIVKIDLIAGIEIIDGVDRTLEIRQAIGTAS